MIYPLPQPTTGSAMCQESRLAHLPARRGVGYTTIDDRCGGRSPQARANNTCNKHNNVNMGQGKGSTFSGKRSTFSEKWSNFSVDEVNDFSTHEGDFTLFSPPSHPSTECKIEIKLLSTEY